MKSINDVAAFQSPRKFTLPASFSIFPSPFPRYCQDHLDRSSQLSVNDARIRITNTNRGMNDASIRISQLISPFENAAFLSPHFEGGTKGNPLSGSLSRTRFVRHRRCRSFRIVRGRIRSLVRARACSARVHVDVQKGDIIPVNVMQAR